jgi:deoxyribose-phosphate aldolase
MTTAELAAKIDHTILKPEALAVDVDRIINEAIGIHAAAVCVAPVWVGRVVEKLAGTGVRTCTVAGFPHGTSKAGVKAFESAAAIRDGAEEVDVVAHLPHLVNGDLDSAREELNEFANASRTVRRNVVLKVIVESAFLMTLGPQRGEAAIAVACRAVRDSGCDFIKTSTGFHPAGGTTVEAVRLMKKHGGGLLIKAAGGIRTLQIAEQMLEAGADRLGMSASLAVLDELRKKRA